MPQTTPPVTLANDLNTSSDDHNPTLSSSSVNPQVDYNGTYNPYFPPINQVSVADLTKFQIEGFRNHLNFINNQLVDNQLRIDVHYLESQRAELLTLIEKMEAMLTIQQAYGRRHDTAPGLTGAMQLSDHTLNQAARNATSEDSCKTTKNEGAAPGSSTLTQVPIACNSALRRRCEMPAVSGTECHITGDIKITKTHHGLDSTVKKSKLTPAAAMAPPFKPRTKAMVAANSFSVMTTEPSAHPAPFNCQSYGRDRITKLDHIRQPPTILKLTMRPSWRLHLLMMAPAAARMTVYP